MKKAVFLLKTIVTPWKPPFKKEITTEEFEVSLGEKFATFACEPKNVFKLVELNGDNCTVEFSEKFTLKGHEHPGDRKVEIGKNPVSFTYLWGENGITKKLSLKSINDF